MHLTFGFSFSELRYVSNAAATWAPRLIQHFSAQNKGKLGAIVLSKLRKQDVDHQNFVAKYMLDTLPYLFQRPLLINSCVNYICKCVENGNKVMETQLPEFATFQAPEEWEKKFRQRLPSVILF